MKRSILQKGFFSLCILLLMVTLKTNQAFSLNFSDFIDNAPGFDKDINFQQDFSWKHNPIIIPNGYSIKYAEVKILAYDVDSDAGPNDPKVIFSGRREVDNVYAFDNGAKIFLGPLIGGSSVWEYSTFVLAPNFFDDIQAGLTLFLDSDALGSNEYWVCQIGTSELKGSMVPIPGALWLLGSGLLICVYRLRNQSPIN